MREPQSARFRRTFSGDLLRGAHMIRAETQTLFEQRYKDGATYGARSAEGM